MEFTDIILHSTIYSTYLLPSTLMPRAAVLTASPSSPRLAVSTSSWVLLNRIQRLGRGSVELKHSVNRQSRVQLESIQKVAQFSKRRITPLTKCGAGFLLL